MQEIFVSTDIEADGPIPGPHSMLSLGSAAFTENGAMIATFSANLSPLDGALDDAIEQGRLFCNMLREHRRGRPASASE